MELWLGTFSLTGVVKEYVEIEEAVMARVRMELSSTREDFVDFPADGEVSFETFPEKLHRVAHEGPRAIAALSPSANLRPGMREALRYRIGKKRVLLDLLISLAVKVDVGD